MTQYEITIGFMLAAQLFTLQLLWGQYSERSKWQAAWLRDTSELLYWKRNAVLRDPNTGKYVKKDKRT
jgi:hypothetical protein